MLWDVLYYIMSILESLFMYIMLIMIEKYVFLEPQMERRKQKIFYIITITIVVITTLINAGMGQYLLALFAAINVVLGRKKRKPLGILIAIWAMGIMNGLGSPILVAPSIVMELSQKTTIIYRLVLYVFIFSLLMVFYFKGKKWRENFNQEIYYRRLNKWEYFLLAGVGSILMVYSYSILVLPKKIEPQIPDGMSPSDKDMLQFVIEYANSLTKDMTQLFGFIAIICFVLSITVIVLVLQGNKRSYYQKKALSSKIAEKEHVERMSLQMVRTLANTIDAKDSYTNGHSTRVAKYSVMIAKRMGYEGEKLTLLEYSALLHDIGKIGIPNKIINKTSRLDDDEYEVIKTHPGIGSKILEEISEIPDIAIGAKYHHERFDGRGYPEGLCGQDIPEVARIIGIADAYDAMTSNRSYRDLLSQEIVRGEIVKGKGAQFDPDIADVMLSIIDEDKDYILHE